MVGIFPPAQKLDDVRESLYDRKRLGLILVQWLVVGAAITDELEIPVEHSYRPDRWRRIQHDGPEYQQIILSAETDYV